MPDDDALTQADYETLAAFRFALRRFMSFSEMAAQGAGLTATQHQALLAIKGRLDDGRAMTVGQLATQLMVAPHSSAELVARLDGAGLVERIVDRADRRRHGLVLTARAEDVLRELTLAHRRELRLLAPRMMEALREIAAYSPQ